MLQSPFFFFQLQTGDERFWIKY